MKHVKALIAPLLFIALAFPAIAAEKLSLNEISRYLNGLKTVKTEFTQINADGTISTGTIYIRRPGRARFEYNPPSDALVIAGGQQLAIFDAKSNTGPTQYPLKRTPLNLILARNVDLSRAGMVVGHAFDGISTTVTAQDPENPEYGNIQLFFTGTPVQLRQWIITDDAGDQTTVILGALEKVSQLNNNLFSISGEIKRRER
ncbi:MAG TPA: outer membrane lipoprotein carrier protein LolA [Aliiroseovarius sp.]|nr:outer membrane lipoprotein carrier protein LolA [Aliiroseovarius sp.]